MGFRLTRARPNVHVCLRKQVFKSKDSFEATRDAVVLAELLVKRHPSPKRITCR